MTRRQDDRGSVEGSGEMRGWTMLLGYLYTMTAAMLAVFYVAVVVTVNALLRWFFGIEVALATRQALATGLGLIVVTGPLWWLHWRGLRWQVDQETMPAGQPLQLRYRTYLSVVVGVALFTVFLSAGASVTVFMRLALGLLPDVDAGWVQGLPWMVALVTATAIWWLHWRPLFGNSTVQQSSKQQSGRLVTAQRGVSG